jgi:hypothetical protein
MQLFSAPSISTMVHGVVLGGGALMALFAALFSLYAMRPAQGSAEPTAAHSRAVGLLLVAAAAALWATVLGGTYVVFPPYRVPPPEGVAALAAYPRAFVLADPSTAWLHSFGMEIKEHVPWIAAMITTAVAYIATRARERLWKDVELHAAVMVLVGLCFALVSFVSLLGVFVNKVAPVQ